MRLVILVLLTFSATNLAFGQFDFDGVPGSKPKLFAAGIVSSENDSEFGIVFDRNSNAAYFTRREKGKPQKIYVTDFAGGKWSAPRIAPFSIDRDEAPFISPDNRTLYFGSTRPIPNRVSKGNFDMNIWQVSRTADGWSAPIPLSEKINKVQIEKEVFPSSNESGLNSIDGENFYFSTQRRSAKGIDIYKTTLRNGEFSEPEKVSGEVNSETLWESGGTLSPDGYYMFLNIYGSPNGFGAEDIFVSRKVKNGWSKPVNLGGLINTKADEGAPQFSPSGKYFFFSRDDKKSESADEDWNVYFIETEALKLESLFELEKIVLKSEVDISYASGIRLKSNGQPFTGTLVEYFPDGKPKMRREVKEGLADGLWMEWLENGNLRYKAEWKRNKGDGLWQYFHNNGKLRTEGFYRNDLAEGVHYTWHESGQLKVKGVYSNDKQQGRWVYLLPNGETEKVEVFENGEKIVQ